MIDHGSWIEHNALFIENALLGFKEPSDRVPKNDRSWVSLHSWQTHHLTPGSGGCFPQSLDVKREKHHRGVEENRFPSCFGDFGVLGMMVYDACFSVFP